MGRKAKERLNLRTIVNVILQEEVLAREKLYEYIIDRCSQSISCVQKGVFGAHMEVSLLNDGPFTIVLDSAEL